ncbi:MAG TPA: S1 RNA-binding domain-containing protein, partial [Dehalococcoidia bacterium]|nr:S1 RNA-binding domain-containing protein [Dehalococcoidia bacterium]
MSTIDQPTAAPEIEDMGALLALESAQPGPLRRGEIIQGMVMGASPDGVIVDVGAKMEAIIPPNEMLSLGVEASNKLSAGDNVNVMVLQPSSAEGHAIVSLDRARGEEGWTILAERLESGATFEGQITGHNRGGILVNVEGVNAFVPLSQVDSVRRDDPDAASLMAGLIGQTMKFKVVELNRKRNRVILSERAAMAEERKAARERVLEEIEEGQVRNGSVSSITDFGIFVDLGGADGLAHMTEITWERGKKAKDLFSAGDEVQVYVLKVDRETKKISLSLKRAHPERWEESVSKFVIGQILIGRVTKLMAFGAFVRLDDGVEGLVHISEIANRRIQHPKEVVNEGDIVPVKLVRIEPERHRLGLSLRQARDDAEAMGFVFDHQGAVVDWPDDIREQYEIGPRNESTPRPTAPKSPQEAIEQAVSRDPEPVSAFAHAFAQALENAETTDFELSGEESAAPEASAAEAAPPVAEPDTEPAATVEASVDEDAPAEAAPAAEASIDTDEEASSVSEEAPTEEDPGEAESSQEV